ncbi:MAG TPA: hypothetical protein VGE47_06530 [Burkholderiaceae bacterium]
MHQHLLVVIDDSDLSMTVVGQALALASCLTARVSFLHLRPAPGGANKGQAALAKAEAAGRAMGLACGGFSAVTAAAADATLEAARRLGCDLVMTVLQSRPEMLAALLAGKLPVQIAVVEAPAPAARALAEIRREHRALSEALLAWQDVLASAAATQQPDIAAPAGMDLMLRGLADLTSLQRRSPLSPLLFRLLRLRTSRLNAELDELVRQQQRDAQLLADLSAAAHCLADGGGAEALTAFQLFLQRYCDLVWEQLGREEGVVLPAALQWLLAEDWLLLDAACEQGPPSAPGQPSVEPAKPALKALREGAGDDPVSA